MVDVERRVRAALLRYPMTSGRRWLRFEQPVDTITAWRLSEVSAAVERATAEAAQGRWVVGFVSYDAGPAFDEALESLRDPTVPLVAFGVFDDAHPSRGPAGGHYDLGEWDRSRSRAEYLEDLAHIRDLIASGDTYQVNHTFRLHAAFEGDPLGLFAALTRAQRGEYMSFIDLGDAAACSASPELFLHREGRRVFTRPMKGTRPRHPDPARDGQLADELVSSAKDRAENTMIVDMVRNDLGRVARVGSVEVPDLYTVEHYPTVHQLTSTVEAELADVDTAELFAATFPAASITGAPKVRTSQIIAELETEPRGIYTGAIGAIEPGGDFEFNVAIRTVWVDTRASRATYGVGGGVVWDSDPADEWDEALDKARILERCRDEVKLLETMRYEPAAGVILLDRHLARLRRSAEHFGYDIDVDEVRRFVNATKPDGASVMRLVVGGDGACDVAVAPLPVPPYQAWRLPVDDVPVDPEDEFLFHKTTRRARYDEARARFPDAPDVVLANAAGELTETTIGNLVFELDGRYVTPPRRCGLLPGTFRAELLDAGTLVESVVTVADIERVRAMWMINSVRGWVPIEIVAPVLPRFAPNADRRVR